MITGVNLIPAKRLSAQQRRRRLHAWIAGGIGWVCLVLAACVGTHLVWGHGYMAIAEQLSQTQTQITDTNAKVAELRKKLADADAERRMTLSISDQPDWSILLRILGSTVGDDVVLREMHLAPDAQQPKQFMLKLHGFGKTQSDVSQFVLRLQQKQLFDNVKLERTGREPIFDKPAVSFEITCTLGETSKGQP